MNQKQLDEVQTRLSNAKHTEDLLNNEILQLKNENIALKDKCDALADVHVDYKTEKSRADDLDRQNSEMRQQLDTLVGKEVR